MLPCWRSGCRSLVAADSLRRCKGVTCPRLLCQCLSECCAPPVCPGGGVGRSDLQRVWGGRAVAEGAVGPDLVVLPAPALDADLGLGQGGEDLRIETLVAERAGAGFPRPVLPGTARCDEARGPAAPRGSDRRRRRGCRRRRRGGPLSSDRRACRRRAPRRRGAPPPGRCRRWRNSGAPFPGSSTRRAVATAAAIDGPYAPATRARGAERAATAAGRQ